MNNFHQKKSLGQHFLKDKNIIRKIVDIADVKKNEQVWEIGPGKGILTEELLNRNCKLTCFEIDEKLYQLLEDRFSDKIHLIKKDILKVNWEGFFPRKQVKIVSNLPFQITSPFLFRVVKYAQHFSNVVVMIQKEVAQKINAKVGTKDYGILTLKMQYYFIPKYEFTVKSHLFSPPPKVDSAVISLTPRLDKPEIENEKFFWHIVETAFRNRRKMLRRNLREIISKEKIEKLNEYCPIDLSCRGETLNEKEFIELYKAIKGL
jgi:16S rRNA (adenine1518-N6/adenine1519-N6)-dimethyltransferase